MIPNVKLLNFVYPQHRMSTILDYDRVMVLDSGCVVEMAPPSQLLEESHSLFYHLVHSMDKHTDKLHTDKEPTDKQSTDKIHTDKKPTDTQLPDS